MHWNSEPAKYSGAWLTPGRKDLCHLGLSVLEVIWIIWQTWDAKLENPWSKVIRFSLCCLGHFRRSIPGSAAGSALCKTCSKQGPHGLKKTSSGGNALASLAHQEHRLTGSRLNSPPTENYYHVSQPPKRPLVRLSVTGSWRQSSQLYRIPASLSSQLQGLVLLETLVSFWNTSEVSSSTAELHGSMSWCPGINGNFSGFGQGGCLVLTIT